jgi:hypothetical protein
MHESSASNLNLQQSSAHIGRSGNQLKPLFSPIEQDRLTPDNEVSLLSSADALRAFDVPEPFIAEVEGLASQLGRLSGLSLARRPSTEEMESLEGRGIYHRLSDQLVVYVKGGGSMFAMNDGQSDHPYPAFPNTVEDLLFDAPRNISEEPRIRGVLSAKGACVEQINAAAVLAQAIKENGWSTVQEVIDAGATIPLGAQNWAGLTDHIGNMIEKYVELGPHLTARESFSRHDRPYTATSMQLVPSDRRVIGGLARKNTDRDSEIASIKGNSAIGQTIRQLIIGSGSVYAVESAHRQNIYEAEDSEKAQYGQADSQDLLTLGYYGDITADASLQKQFGVGNVIPKDIVRKALIFMQLNRGDLAPYHTPISGRDWTEEDILHNVLEPQQAFWNGLLRGVADQHAIDRIPNLLPYMNKEIQIAASILLHDASNHEEWELIAEQKEHLIDTIDGQLGVAEEYKFQHEDAIDELEVASFDRALRDNNLGIKRLVNYLKTGDERFLQNNRNNGLAHKLKLEEAVASIPNVSQRVSLMQAFGEQSMQYDVMRLEFPETLDEEFGHLQTELVLDLIEQDKIKQALETLLVIQTASDPLIREEMTVVGGGEFVGHYYGLRAATSQNEDQVNELLNDVYLELQVQRFTEDILPVKGINPPKTAHEMREQAIKALQRGSHNMNDFTTAHDLPPVDVVARNLLKNVVVDGIVRYRLTEWMQQYTDARKIVETYDSRISQTNLQKSYDILSAFLGGQNTPLVEAIPELSLIHDAWMAHRLKLNSLEGAESHFHNATAYYSNIFPARRAASMIDPYSMRSPENNRPTWLHVVRNGSIVKPLSSDGQLSEVIAMYAEIPLPAIADKYRKILRKPRLADQLQ